MKTLNLYVSSFNDELALIINILVLSLSILGLIIMC